MGCPDGCIHSQEWSTAVKSLSCANYNADEPTDFWMSWAVGFAKGFRYSFKQYLASTLKNTANSSRVYHVTTYSSRRVATSSLGGQISSMATLAKAYGSGASGTVSPWHLYAHKFAARVCLPRTILCIVTWVVIVERVGIWRRTRLRGMLTSSLRRNPS